jgi:hypothetical protein
MKNPGPGKNVPPGTIVDTVIVRTGLTEFFLVSGQPVKVIFILFTNVYFYFKNFVF